MCLAALGFLYQLAAIAASLVVMAACAGLHAAWNFTGMFLVAAIALPRTTIAGAMRSSVRAIA